VEGTAVFLTAETGAVPNALLHNLKHNKVLHERNLFVTVRSHEVPRIDARQRLDVTPLGHDCWQVIVNYGFKDNPDLPSALAVSEDDGNVEARAKFARRTIQARKAHAVALIMCPLVDISPCKIERARRLGDTQRSAHLKIAAGFIASASIDNATKRMATSWNAVLFKSDKKRRLNVSRQHAILRGVTKIMTARDRDQSQIALVRVATLPTNIRIHIAKFLYHTVPVPT
jgi:hypothetical protein